MAARTAVVVEAVVRIAVVEAVVTPVEDREAADRMPELRVRHPEAVHTGAALAPAAATTAADIGGIRFTAARPRAGKVRLAAGGIRHNGSPEHFAAGNNTWQEPPAAAGHASPAVNHYVPASGTRPVVVGKQPTHGASGSIHAAGAVAGPPHVFPPHRGRGGYPDYFYNPYPYFGFGWGGGLWWGGFYPCDPFLGLLWIWLRLRRQDMDFMVGACGSDYGADLSYSSPDDAGGSQEPNPTLFAAPAGRSGAIVRRNVAATVRDFVSEGWIELRGE